VLRRRRRFRKCFRFGAGAEEKNFPEVAAGGVESSARRGGEGGDLSDAGFDQIGESSTPFDGENVTAIAGAGEEASVLIEAESVDEDLVGGPQARRGAIGRNAIDFGASGSANARERERAASSWAQGELR